MRTGVVVVRPDYHEVLEVFGREAAKRVMRDENEKEMDNVQEG